MNTNVKVKESKGYEYWATKHNLNTMAESVIFLREQGIKSVKQLDEYIQKSADERQNLQDKIKVIDKEIQELSATMEQVHTVKKYRAYYREYKANPSDKTFFEEYKAQIALYENALSELKKSHSKLPNSKDILDRLDKLQEKRIPLCKSILPQNLLWKSFIRYEKIMGFIWAMKWRDERLNTFYIAFHLIFRFYLLKSFSVFLKFYPSFVRLPDV